VEERLARLEAHVEHIQSDVAKIGANICRLDQKIDAVRDSLGQKIDAVRDSLEQKIDAFKASQDRRIDSVEEKIDSVEEKIVAVKDSVFESRLAMERSFSKLTLWGLTLYVALAASMLGVMAKGFGWIR